MMPLKDQLLQIGLASIEASIYAFLLEKGPVTARQLYKTLSLNRVTTYNVLETMMRKGLVSAIETEKKKKFMAEPPRRLHDLLAEREKMLAQELHAFEDNQLKLKQHLADLEFAYESMGEKPKVRFLEGTDGMKTIREDILTTMKDRRSPVYNIFSEQLMKQFRSKEDLDLEHRKKILQHQAAQHIQHIALFHAESEDFTQEIAAPNLHLHRVDAHEYPFSSEMVIYGDKIVFLSPLGRVTSVVIENSEIAKTLVSLFRLALKALEGSGTASASSEENKALPDEEKKNEPGVAASEKQQDALAHFETPSSGS